MPAVPAVRRLLVAPEDLHAELGDPALRVFDATVELRPGRGGTHDIVGRQDSYEAARVPGAAFADLWELSDPASPYPFMLPSPERFALAAGRLGIGEGTRVVVYAQASPMWATRMWWVLRFFGFDEVRVLDGGLPAWRAAGLPLETGARTYPPASFLARPRPELLATREDVEAIADGSAPACLINALDPASFRGEQAPGRRPGRIPNSVNVPWAGLLDPATNRFRPAGQLADLLADVREAPNLVAYCGGGISATLDVFALALTGREDARVYDGSLSEWAADPALPLVTG